MPFKTKKKVWDRLKTSANLLPQQAWTITLVLSLYPFSRMSKEFFGILSIFYKAELSFYWELPVCPSLIRRSVWSLP